MKKGRTKVMIVEDSMTQLILLEEIINSDPRLLVVATARSAEEAIRLLSRARPDVVSMDIHLPEMNGYEATEEIMRVQPVPIVVVSASVNERETEISMNSLKAGALTVVQKPPSLHHPLSTRLCDQLAIMSEVKVVRRRGARSNGLASMAPPARAGGLPREVPELVGIVASTGGPPALASLLGALPSDYPIPIVVVQHMTTPFLGGFIKWLNDRCSIEVIPAVAGAMPRPHRAYVAPGGAHLELTSSGFSLSGGEPVSFQRPSGTVLFRSMAATLGAKAMGVLLTGMGDDGARGLLELRNAGAYTVVEHASTAVVYGMPRAAQDLGAAAETLPLPEIVARLLALGREVNR